MAVAQHNDKPDFMDPIDHEFEAAQVGPAALLRLEIRYLRRDVVELKDEVRQGLAAKADRAELSKEVVLDHENRLRALERRIYWAIGFGAAIGAGMGVVIRMVVR